MGFETRLVWPRKLAVFWLQHSIEGRYVGDHQQPWNSLPGSGRMKGFTWASCPQLSARGWWHQGASPRKGFGSRCWKPHTVLPSREQLHTAGSLTPEESPAFFRHPVHMPWPLERGDRLPLCFLLRRANNKVSPGNPVKASRRIKLQSNPQVTNW